MVDRREFLQTGLQLSAALGVAQLGAGPARAAAGELVGTGSPWPLRNSEAFQFESAAIGDKIAVGVWSHPRFSRARSGSKQPALDVIYVLDGSFVLAPAAAICSLLAADTIDPGFPPVLLVGLDYVDDKLNARTRDYTMRDSVPEYVTKMVSKGDPRTTPGGADKFLAFLETELDPLIRAKYNTTDKPAGIIGDSFGGTFTFYAFLRQSKLFDRYWLGSPAIYPTPADYLAQFEAGLKKPLVHPTRMYLSMGSKEMAGGLQVYEDIGRSFNRILSALRRVPNPGLTWSSKVYDGYTHTSVFMPALNDALVHLYGKSAA